MDQKKLDEFSLAKLAKRKEFKLASPTTRHFSTERRGIMGDAPKSTKLISSKFDKNKDYVTFYFLTEATEKYGPNHQYKDTNPSMMFALERDPSATYEIWIRFFRVSQLSKLSKSRQQKKAFNPNSNKQVQGPANRVSIEEIKAWLWDTDFQVWSNSPSFHWQGFNYNLSKLDASIFPTDIAPTNKHLGASGRPVMGWKDVHGPALIDKHLLDLFTHIKFFINQMAGSLIKQIREPNTPQPPMPEPTPAPSPKTPPNAPAPQEEPEPSPQTNVPMQQAKQQAVQQQPIAQQVMANRTVNSPVNQQIQQSQAYPGNPNENPQQYNLDKEETPMPENTVQSIYGTMLIQEVEGKQYKTWYNTKVEHLKNRVLELDSKCENYEFEFPTKLNIDERTNLYESLSKLKEVTIQFETGKEDSRYQQMIEVTLNYVKENNLDVITVESTLSDYAHAHMSKVLIETIQLAFPMYNKIIANSKNTNAFTISLIKRDRNPLHEIESFPGNKEQTGEENPVEPKGKADMEDPNKGLPAPPTEEDNKVPGKKLVCSFGSFNPPTKQHFEMLKKVKATADHQQAEAIVFLQRDKTFNGDEVSIKQRAQIIEQLSGLKCCVDKEITDFNAAMDWAYTRHFGEVMVIAGSDETKDMLEIGTTNKGQHTDQGFFDFEHFRVASYGGNNPDDSEESIEAVNAVMNNDEKGFLRAIDLPYIKQLKKLFAICRYEIQNKMGMNESTLNEMTPKDIYSALTSPERRRLLVKALDDNNDFLLGTKLKNPETGMPMSRGGAQKTFNAMKIKLGGEGQTLERLLNYYYPAPALAPAATPVAPQQKTNAGY